MKLTSQIELMKNQKHAEVMSPDIAFDVLQTPSGDALFFSIGTDHVFYVTREVRSSETGWTKINLSSQLPNLAGATAKAKSFDLSQNLATGNFDIVLVVTVDGNDRLYSTQGHSSDSSDWTSHIVWTSLPFDAKGSQAPSPLVIAGVYLMDIPDQSDPTQLAVQNCFVDVLRDPKNPMNLLDRYYINLDTPTKWVRHRLPIDLKAGSISSCLGYRDRDMCPGIYTYGLIEDTRQVIYGPQRNVFRPDVPPNPARFVLPPQATAIGSCAAVDGNTFLFLAANDGLFIYGPDNQDDGSQATLVVPTVVVGKNNLFAGISSMSATSIGGKTVVWLLNAQGDLFKATCSAGSELDPSAWSKPIPFCSNVQRYAFYLNKTTNSNNVVFAHLSGEQMAEFTQLANSSSGEWARRDILLPTTKADEFIEFNSFTATITVTDDSDMKQGDVAVDLTADSAVAAYINNVYRVLSPDFPLQVHTDATGTVTIVQQTDKLLGVAIRASLSSAGGTGASTSTMDPLAKAQQKLATVQSGDDLGKITIKDSNGVQKPLVPADVSAADRNSAASAIKQLLQVKDTLSSSQSPVPTTSTASAANAQPNHLVAASGANSAVLISGSIGIPLSEAIGKSLKVAAGDLFNFFKEAWNKFEDFVIDFAQGAWQFIVKIGETIYRAVIDTANAVWEAISYVIEKIKVAFEDLVAWLGFLFNWKDIIRTQRVIKHELYNRAQGCINSIDFFQGAIEHVLIDLEDRINAWADITDPGKTYGVQQKQGSGSTGIKSQADFDSPQSSWATYHTKNGLGSATSSPEKAVVVSQDGALQKILDDLKGIVDQEVHHVETAIDQIRAQVVEPFNDLTAVQVLKKIVAICADLALKSARTVIVKLLDIAKILLQSILDALDAPLDIPVISPFYKTITGSELSVLDLMSLIGAIPTTIAFKIIAGRAPFPDDASVSSSTSALDSFRARRTQLMTTQLKIKQQQKPIATGRKAASEKSMSSFRVDEEKASVKAAAAEAKEPWGGLDTAIVIFDMLAIPGSICTIITSVMKQGKTATTWSKPVKCFAFLGNLVYIAPNYAAWQDYDTWPVIMNDICFGLCVIKSGVDNTVMNPKWQDAASGYVEMVLNFIWLAPAIGGIVGAGPDRTDDEWTLFGANVAFDLAGILTPAAQKNKKIFIAQMALTGCYGVLGGVTGGLYLKRRL